MNYGFGMHQIDLDPEQAMQVIKWAFLGQIYGIMASAIVSINQQ